MKLALVALLAAVVAAPVVYVPTPSDAQVRVGSGARRDAPRRARPAPRLSEAEENRMFAAQDEILDIDGELASIRQATEAAGAVSPEQQARIDALGARRSAAQQIVDRLEAKLNR